MRACLTQGAARFGWDKRTPQPRSMRDGRQRRHPTTRRRVHRRLRRGSKPARHQGIGELAATSVAPAIANAVYHATGKRVRDLPITVEKLL
jgi:CO/xanthine dehydrogenase Mo-binding subunit